MSGRLVTIIHTGDPPLRLLAAFFENFPGQTPEHILQVPEREMWGMATARDSGRFTIVAPDLGDEVSVTLESARNRQSAVNRPLPDWARFPVGVIATMAEAGFVLYGVDIALAGEEPSGPRYTYALGLATAALLHELAQQSYSADRLTALVERVRLDG